jgi:molecular chaperone GrpE (heat shock protein)
MKRYDIFAYCSCEDNDINYERDECETGDWVRFEDANAEIERLEATVSNRCDEVERCHADIERLKDELEHYRGIAMTEQAEKALADYQRLRDALEWFRDFYIGTVHDADHNRKAHKKIVEALGGDK